MKAAIEGRVLVLEGIDKAERNVLPILNNLLENREMQLDDGRWEEPAKSDVLDPVLKRHCSYLARACSAISDSDNLRICVHQ